MGNCAFVAHAPDNNLFGIFWFLRLFASFYNLAITGDEVAERGLRATVSTPARTGAVTDLKPEGYDFAGLQNSNTTDPYNSYDCYCGNNPGSHGYYGDNSYCTILNDVYKTSNSSAACPTPH